MTKLPRDITSKVNSRHLAVDAQFKDRLKRKLTSMEENDMATSKTKQAKERGMFTLFKYNFASVAVLLAVIVLVGGASAVVSSNRAEDNVRRQTALPQTLDDVVSLEEIRRTALQDMPNGSVSGIELEQEDAGLVYKVKFGDGSVRLYDAKTGKAITQPVGTAPIVTAPASSSSSVSLQQARDIAQKERPGKIIKKIQLEVEQGKTVYSVRFSDGGRVDLNASNGVIVRVEGPNQSGGSNSANTSSGLQNSNSLTEDDSHSSGSDSDSNSDDSSSGRDSDRDSDSGGSGSGRSGGSDD